MWGDGRERKGNRSEVSRCRRFLLQSVADATIKHVDSRYGVPTSQQTDTHKDRLKEGQTDK